MTRRVLLLGSTGMLGRALRASAPEGVEIVGPARVELLDLAATCAAIDAHAPDVIINAAAYTQVDRAEADQATARRINGDAPTALAVEAAARGIRFVHFSTDYVFPGDGTIPYAENDAPSPVNAYGASKLLGEQGIIASSAEALIIRTQWLFGAHGRSFPRTMWERARHGEPTRVVDDQFGRPTYAVDLAEWTWSLAASESTGILHAANGGVASWFDVAARVFARAGASDVLTPCGTADFPTPARRPRYSVLATDRLRTTLGHDVPDWMNALDRFLDTIDA